MLTIFGDAPRGTNGRFCDGVSRREFLQIGGLALGGLSLPQLLRAEQAAGVTKSHKAIIMIFLPGGPPHQDMWDIKTDAPAEIRGEFQAIKTSVSGIEIGEMFPRIAASMQKFVPIRSIVGADGDHFAYQCLTGWRRRDRQPQGGWPSMGSVLSKLYGPVDSSVPAFVGLSPRMGHMPWADNGVPGFLGVAHAPFTPNAEGKDDLVLNGVSLDRLGDRREVLTALDRFRRDADAGGQLVGTDAFTQQAFGVLTSSKLAEALDIEKEDPKLRERYGRGVNQLRDDGGPRLVDNFLIARRLVSAGARCVSLAFSRWDWHNANFKQGREDMPLLDQGVAALVEDLELRGMLDDTTVIVWGEFGRTPKINKDAGRDHWPQVSCALLAGGGMKTGQVIGSTNRLGEHAVDRPVHFQEVFATLYKNLGINVDHLTLRDLQGRPQFLIDQNLHRPMHELV
ncbi:MAG: DUF1501 domain-containing protein [Planctomycetaceae bacterium]|nr:DUF1501 domain-containing protein [Planctomycetaceae bacterium]